MKPTYTYAATIVDVHDGDTITVDVDLGFFTTRRTVLRLNAINAPELSTDEGKAARDYLKRMLPVGTPVTIKTFKDPKDKYGRWLADVDMMDGSYVNSTLVANGFAKLWDGKGVKPV